MHQSPTTNHQPPHRRWAFTLVELLVVITIIGILVALVSVAVVRAIDTAKQTRIKAELDQIDMALKAYKEKYGSYPPCDLQFNVAAPLLAIRQHVARAFPRYNLANLVGDLEAAGVDGDNFRPDQALVFWLRGFGPDPSNPFVTTNDLQITNGMPGTKVPRTEHFSFDVTRLATKDSRTGGPTSAPMPSYMPAGLRVTVSPPIAFPNSPFQEWSAGGAPYVYYDTASYGLAASSGNKAQPTPFNVSGAEWFQDAGSSVPYWLDTNGNGESNVAAVDLDSAGNPLESWANRDSFQLIASGSDGKFGRLEAAVPVDPPRLYPTGAGYDTTSNFADDDNVTNFAQNARLGDAKP